MNKIAYLVRNYLNRTETFIYEPLRNIKDFEVLVLTNSTRNLEEFPYKSIYSKSSLSGADRLRESFFDVFGRSAFYERTIKDNDIKLLHVHFATEAVRSIYLKKKFDLPFVASFYGFDVYLFIKDPIYRLQLKKLFRLGDLFLTFSERMREHVIGLGCPPEKIRTHHGGADFSKFDFKQRRLVRGERINLLIVARFVEKKGIDYGIKAFARIADKFPDASLNIVGDGDLRGEIESLIAARGLGTRVNLLGSKSHFDYIGELERAHVMLAPSVAAKSGDEEGGINTAVIEAFATGLPVIATQHSGSELVFDGRTGYIVKERDEADLAQKLDLVLSNPEKLASLGTQARELVERDFDITKQTRKLESIYKELINKHGG